MRRGSGVEVGAAIAGCPYILTQKSTHVMDSGKGVLDGRNGCR